MGIPKRKNRGLISSSGALGFFSDLFAALTFVFLFLYIIASLQNNILGITKKYHMQELEKKYEDRFKSVVDEYESILESYRKDSVASAEKGIYKRMLAKVEKIEEESKDKIQEKRKKIQQERAFIRKSNQKINEINKLKEMMKHMITANKALVQRIKKSKKELEVQHVLEKKDIKQKYIAEIEAEKKRKQALQLLHEKERESLKETYAKNVEEEKKRKEALKMLHEKEKEVIKQTYAQKVEAEKRKEEIIKQLHAKEKAKIKQSEQNRRTQASLQMLEEFEKQQLQINSKYQAMQQDKKSLKAKYSADLSQEKAKLTAEFESRRAEYGKQIKSLSDEIGKIKAAKAGLEKKYDSSLAKEKEAMKSGYESKLKGYSDKIAALEKAKGDLEGKVGELNRKAGLRKSIGDSLRDAFAKNGINAKVDPKTGEVIIQFRTAYYEFDSARLKKEMKEIIDRVIPVFAKTLLSNDEYSDNIASFEIVGFASPIYKGVIIDDVTSPLGKESLGYNMNLSYRRAKSIFDYIFRSGGREFEHKNDMLRITKVSSLSHIVSRLNKKKRQPASTVETEPKEELSKGRALCEEYTCSDWQKVAIRINLVD